MQKGRDLSFDAFRGLAMIAVIAAHACGTAFSEKSVSIDKWNFYFLLSYVQSLLFTVPALIFMSGYWSSKRPIKSLQDYRIFLTRKLPRILIPYFFWSLILLGYSAVKTQSFDAYKIALKLLTGQACYPYYFVIVLVQLYIITPVLHYINSKKYGLILVFAFNLIILFALYLSRVQKAFLHLPMYLPFYSWVIYYQIGLLVGTHRNKSIAVKGRYLLILPAILFFLLISEIEAAILISKYNNLSFAISPMKYSTFLYSICIIIAFLRTRESVRHWPKFLVIAGNYSFGIYLIHIPILHQVAKFVKANEVIYSFQLLYQFVIVVLTFSICLVIIGITRKLLPGSFCGKVLGF